MDHAVTGGCGLLPAIQVPYFPEYEYDHLEFATFPERQGFTKDGTIDINRPCHELKAFLQAWLYFGLIEVFRQKRLKVTDFIRTYHFQGKERQVVHSETLPKTLSKARVKFRPEGHKFKIWLILMDSLKIARRWTTVFDKRPTDDEEMVIIILSIQVLIATLARWFEFRPVPGPKDNSRSNSSLLLRKRLLDAGWCVNRIHDIFRTEDCLQVYRLAQIPRQEPTGGKTTHDACSVERCLTYGADERTYRTSHAEVGCQCDLLESPYDKLYDIVQRGGIPLIDVGAICDEQVELKVVEWNSSSKYTAISHLWIDGLGNFHENSLPRCQLRRLSKRVAEMKAKKGTMGCLTLPWSKGPLLMWIDTLCIPIPQLQDDVSTRIKAIDQVPWIYAGANKVLILDAELECIDAKAEPWWQLQARMTRSRWNARGWALLEGCMEQQLLFQFQRSTVKIAEKERKWLLGHEVSSTKKRAFATAWNNIASRYIAKAEDAHQILAALLGFSTVQVMSIATPVERTKAMLDAIGCFPLSMLWNSGPRPDAACDTLHRWVPSMPGSQQLTHITMLLQRTSEGLELGAPDEFPPIRWRRMLKIVSFFVQFWHAKLPSMRVSMEEPLTQAEEKPRIYLIPRGTSKDKFWFSQQDACGNRTWFEIRCDLPENDCLNRSATQTACLIIEPSRDASAAFFRGARMLVADNEPRSSSGEKVVGETTSEENSDKTVYVTYDCPISCRTSARPPTWRQVTSMGSILSARSLPSESKLVIKHSNNQDALGKMSRRGPDPRVPENVIYFYLPMVFVAVGGWFAMTDAVGNGDSLTGNILQEIKPIAVVGSLVLGIILSLLLWVAKAPIVKWRNRRAFRKWCGTYSESWV